MVRRTFFSSMLQVFFLLLRSERAVSIEWKQYQAIESTRTVKLKSNYRLAAADFHSIVFFCVSVEKEEKNDSIIDT